MAAITSEVIRRAGRAADIGHQIVSWIVDRTNLDTRSGDKTGVNPGSCDGECCRRQARRLPSRGYSESTVPLEDIAREYGQGRMN